jgi:hypothetical protein
VGAEPGRRAFSPDGRAVERRTLKRAVAILVALALLATVLATRAIRAARAENRSATAAQPVPRSGRRVRVEVLNGTRTRGLARRTTLYLRDRGFDVVEIGTADTLVDSTIVLDRSGHPEWANEVADALGGARVESRPDTSRYLDVTVLIGRAGARSGATPQPFYP